MFTGIVEDLGEIVGLVEKDGILELRVVCAFTNELSIDESVAHNGVCLTVVDIDKKESSYLVQVIQESLNRSNLGKLKLGDQINLERAMKWNGRLDGHLVQGHVDGTASCININEKDGNWRFRFEIQPEFEALIVEKGSIAINGVSLTLALVEGNEFEVAIIPYTLNNTSFKDLKTGDIANIEYDIVGKYVNKSMKAFKKLP